MPQGRRNPGTKTSNGKNKSDIGLGAIIHFIEYIGILCAALGVLSLAGLLLLGIQDDVAVLYVLCIAINAIVFVGSRLGVKYLKKRDEYLGTQEAAARQKALAQNVKPKEVNQ